MAYRVNKNQEYLANSMWQRNLNNARSIHINLDSLLDDSFSLLHDLLKNFKSSNDTDPGGLLLSLLTCIGHIAGNSEVKITNHTTNLNLFLLLVGPSGCGKSKIIGPIKKSMVSAMKIMGLSKDEAGILDDFTTASLSAKLAKSNVFVITDEAEKPLLELGFYSPLSEGSAADRISGCKFFGTIPTSKDTMTYHLEIASHLSFVGATTGRLWPRLVNYYAQGYQSDGFSERFLHYAMPKKDESTLNFSQTIEYDDLNDENNGDEEDISDNEFNTEKNNKIDQNLPSLTQIFIVARLIGNRVFHLSRIGTKKYHDKVRQYQELSHVEKPNDINYGSRMGKGAEILCKLAAISEIVKITLEILKNLRDQNQLQYDDISLAFVRNVTHIIQNKYPSTNSMLEIKSSSCRLAGQIFCSHLLKMLFAFYNVEPVLSDPQTNIIETIPIQTTMNTIRERIFQMPQLIFVKRDLTGPMGLLRHFPTDMVNSALNELTEYELIRQGPYITTTTRGIIYMKSFPSNNTLMDPTKRSIIERILNDINLDLPSYMPLLTNSIIKDKQILTITGKQVLLLPEHKFLCEKLKEQYPARHIDSIMSTNSDGNSNSTLDHLLHTNSTIYQSSNNQITEIAPEQYSNQNNIQQTYDSSNQLSTQSENKSSTEEHLRISISDNSNEISSIIDRAQENTIIQQNHRITTVVNLFTGKNQFLHSQSPKKQTKINILPDVNQALSTVKQTNLTDPLNGKNLNYESNFKDINPLPTDILQSENKSESNQEISDVTSNVELQNLASPIAHILLAKSLMVNLVDQVVSNNINKINHVTRTQLPISNTITPNSISTSSEKNSSVALNQDLPQINDMITSEPTSSNTQDTISFKSHSNKRKKQKECLNETVKMKRNPKRKTIKKN